MKRLLFVLAILILGGGALLMRLPTLIDLAPQQVRRPVLRALWVKGERVPEAWSLAARPMHTDEAVHAIRFGDLLERNEYQYRVEDYHGPTLNYATLIPAWIRGQTRLEQVDEFTLRIVPIAFGVGLMLLLALVGDGLGRPAALAAGLLMIVSHAFVFYSRYYIMEVLLVFFTFLAIVSFWRYVRSRSAFWAAMTGVSLALMFATKETWVISLAGFAFSGAAVWLWRKVALMDAEPGIDPQTGRPLAPPPTPHGPQDSFADHNPAVLDELGDAGGPEGSASARSPGRTRWIGHLLVGLVAYALVWLAFFSSFGTHWQGLVDSYRAYQVYFGRGAGAATDHVHGWDFYLRMLLYWKESRESPLVWSEALIVGLSAVGFLAALAGRGLGRANVWFLRFLALYAASVTLAYCVIPYKTPWCLLVFLHPMTLLAGVGAAAIFRLVHPAVNRIRLDFLVVYAAAVTVFGLGYYPPLLREALAALNVPTLETVGRRAAFIGLATAILVAAYLCRRGSRKAGAATGLAWAVLLAMLACGAFQLGSQAGRGAYRYPADPRNPYVYAHSVPDVIRLGHRVQELAALHEKGRDMPVKVANTWGWPLPWYLRGLTNVRYSPGVPANLTEAAVIIAPVDEEPPPGQPPTPPLLDGQAKDLYVADFYGLRPNVLLNLYVRNDLWAKYLAKVSGGAAPAPATGAATGPATGPAPRPAQPPATAPATVPATVPAATQRAVTVGAANWKPGVEVHRFTHAAMATDFEVIILGGPAEVARQAADAAFAEVDYIEGELSRFIPGNDIWRINHAEAGKSETIGLPAMECLLLARQFHKDTGGVFDVTVGSLLACWRSSDRTPRTPTDEELARAKTLTGMHLLALDDQRQTVLVLAKGVQVDLGGIGKGFAVDRMASVLKEREVGAALMHGGRSTVLAIGSPPGKKGWDLAFREIPGSKLELPTLTVTDRSVSGSSQGSKPHIIDPRTGRFVTDRLGAWSAAPTAAESDALSTAFMLMTPKQIEDYCKARPDVSAIIAVRENGRDRLITFGKW